ncbi:DNA replication licensing factor MCM9 [Echinococcus granulosus]|uniref:DNA helicase n=1 Tax=Echinococcus granulosus TaxID=6210 RepID=W6U7A4_ECHGR|nr:DNA replication licensing factor MCM9 [Echinococcus granulosus]EUB54247.1 DNA replication licensing factor MCM9 [Echinococcus granulosus]
MENFQTVDKSRIALLFTEFVNKDYGDVIGSRLQSSDTGRGEQCAFSLVVNFSSLCEFSSILSRHLLSAPMDTLSTFNDTLSCIIADHTGNSKFSPRCTVRVVSLPPISEVFRHVMPKSDDFGRFLALQCTVTRVGAIQVVELERSYSCSKCGHTVKAEADFNQFYTISPPRRCPNFAVKCNSTSFNVVVKGGSSPLHSFQEIRVNERLSYLAVGRMPRSMVCCLDGELVDTVRPGDDIIMNGILTHRWRPPKVGSLCDIETVFRANSIENLSEMRFHGELGGDNFTQEMCRRFSNYWSLAKHKGDFGAALRLRDEIVKSICPDVYGLYFVKLSLALVLVGAPPCLDKSDYGEAEGEKVGDMIKDGGTDFRVRGSIHLLLIGEPSTAKSALLRASCRLAGRAIFTAATGSTAAGLTAAAVRDTSGWALEAGALVLADGGVCAIDEFTSLRGADRAAVHEAMEQQTVSLAKAGLVTRLNCRCAVIAASSLPADAEHSPNLLPTPLLSRFDLVWRLLDPVGCEAWDSAVADHVLGFKAAGEDRNDISKSKLRRITWTTEELQNYISWVRGEFQPRLSSGAATLLQRYYELRRRTLQLMHGKEENQAVAGRTTLRLLESLVRLTQAHARLMARCVAVVEDAVVVIWLMDSSFQSTFGRSASAIEVSGCCLSPEETVKRHNVEHGFEEVLDVVFAQLNLDPLDIDSEWFGSVSSTKPEFQPICMSTQVNGQGTSKQRSPKSEVLSGGALFSIGSVEPCDKLNVADKSFRKTENFFDLDVDSFMPTEFPCISKLAPVNTLQSTGSNDCFADAFPAKEHGANDQSTTETVSAPTVGEKQDCALYVSSQERPVLKTLPQPPNGFSVNNFSKQTGSSVNTSKKGSNRDTLDSRIKGKLSYFAFTEGTTFTDESSSNKEIGASQTELISGAENDYLSPKRAKLRAQNDFLNFQNLAPEGWTFANIDTDFDL